MRIMRHSAAFCAAILTTFAVPCFGEQDAPQQPMSFFVTSVGLGNGGNLGSLAGADSHCQTLAASVGRGNIAWRAYLGQAPAAGLPLVNARDRIGTGPRYNVSGIVIAWNVDDLHEDRNNVPKPTAVDENGAEVNGSCDEPNRHAILTGSDSSGRLVPGNGALTTCNNWTCKSEGNAIVGHHDRLGGSSASWNSVHSSRGCNQEDLAASGGAGLLYCQARVFPYGASGGECPFQCRDRYRSLLHGNNGGGARPKILGENPATLEEICSKESSSNPTESV